MLGDYTVDLHTHKVIVSLLIIMTVAVGCALVYWLRHRTSRRQIRLKADHGREMEEYAADVLEDAGYRVIGRHPKITYVWHLGGEPVETTVEADYLVKYQGRKWLVEVKTGQAAQPTRRETRRQLLEYAHYTRAAGLLFVNGDTGIIQTVEFPPPNPPEQGNITRIWLIIGLITATIGAIWCFWH